MGRKEILLFMCKFYVITLTFFVIINIVEV